MTRLTDDLRSVLPLVLALAGIAAALIVWVFPGTDDRIGFALAIAGVALALATTVVNLS